MAVIVGIRPGRCNLELHGTLFINSLNLIPGLSNTMDATLISERIVGTI